MLPAKDIVFNPRLIVPCKHILLLSHMRANSTLIGHIIGSNDDVSGYYEMHIGYYSWKSLINQKFNFHRNNIGEPVTQYYFDKVLHSEHHVSHDILLRDNVFTLICLREPSQTINSIIKLYKNKHPEDDFTNAEFAANYYKERVGFILESAKRLVRDNKRYYYYDAKEIIEDTETVLSDIQSFIGLDSTFSQEYRQFDKTGARYYGDSSEYIRAGVIVKKTPEVITLDVDATLMDECTHAYRECQAYLRQHSWQPCVKKTA